MRNLATLAALIVSSLPAYAERRSVNYHPFFDFQRQTEWHDVSIGANQSVQIFARCDEGFIVSVQALSQSKAGSPAPFVSLIGTYIDDAPSSTSSTVFGNPFDQEYVGEIGIMLLCISTDWRHDHD